MSNNNVSVVTKKIQIKMEKSKKNNEVTYGGSTVTSRGCSDKA
jgi:hypothetical protein